MKNLRLGLIALFLGIGCYLDAQITSFIYPYSSSLLIDVGIQGIESAGTDQSAAGQIGFRQENFFSRFEVKFTAASSLKDPRQTGVIRNYANFILNPSNSPGGFDAFQVSYLRRNVSRKGAIVNYARYLFSVDSLSSAEFDQLICDFELGKSKNLLHRLGYLVDFNMANFSWTNDQGAAVGGNIIALNPYLIYNIRTHFLSNQVDIFTGLGPSLRAISGAVKNKKDYLNKTLGNDQSAYLGAQFTFQAYINNFYAKANYALYGARRPVDGLTNGQLYVSIGLQAKIGQTTRKTKAIRDLMRRDLPFNR